MGAAAGFAAFTASGAVGNTGPATSITGNVGTANGAVTGLAPQQVTDSTHSTDGVAAQAAQDVLAAYADLGGRPPGTLLTYLGNVPATPQILTAGGYYTSGAIALTERLTLDGQTTLIPCLSSRYMVR